MVKINLYKSYKVYIIVISKPLNEKRIIMINTNIEFGGFYESIHSNNIDYMIDNYYLDDDGNPLDYYELNIPYATIHNAYIKSWVFGFSEFIKNDYNIIIDFNELELISPKYYNYSTDTIDCKITKKK